MTSGDTLGWTVHACCIEFWFIALCCLSITPAEEQLSNLTTVKFSTTRKCSLGPFCRRVQSYLKESIIHAKAKNPFTHTRITHATKEHCFQRSWFLSKACRYMWLLVAPKKGPEHLGRGQDSTSAATSWFQSWMVSLAYFSLHIWIYSSALVAVYQHCSLSIFCHTKGLVSSSHVAYVSYHR